MNGAVFHVSAMIITISACGSSPSQTVLVPSRVFTNPRFGSTIVFHMIAVTTVSTAHGTSTTVRSRPWPLKAVAMISAIARPRSVSRPTDAIVKTNVVTIASRNVGVSERVDVVAQPGR